MTRLVQLALLLAVIIPFGMARAANAQEQTFYLSGNEMLEACKSKSQMVVGFMMGAVDGIRFQSYFYDGTLRVCVPKEVSAGQIRDIVCRHLEENPKVRHYPTIYAVGSAVSEAFPCPKEKP